MFRRVTSHKLGKCAFGHPFANQAYRRFVADPQERHNIGMSKVFPSNHFIEERLNIRSTGYIIARQALVTDLLYVFHVMFTSIHPKGLDSNLSSFVHPSENIRERRRKESFLRF
jgi:hypothetical protein